LLRRLTELHENSRISLPSIFVMFLRLGLLSFGGGLTGWMHREVVVRKSWLSDDVFLTGLALAQILPGTNVTNLAVYIGQHLRGPVGAATALLGLVSGPFLAVIAFASVYGRIAMIPWVYAALEGLAAAAVGLLIMMAVRSVRHSAHDLASVLVILGTFAGISLFELPLVPVAACAAAVSVAAALWQGRRRKGNPDA
jgi:chromate transporter